MPGLEIGSELPSHYDARISLRISTQTIDPDMITAKLGMQPDSIYRKGETQFVARGRVRARRPQARNCWTARLSQITSPPDSLPGELSRQLDQLERLREFFDAVRADGGSSEFFIGYFMRKFNTGDTFEASLLGRLAEFGIGLGLDIYEPAGER